MKKILLPVCFLLPAALFSQELRVAGAIRFNASTLVLRDPQNSARSPERTGYALTPGFGIALSHPAGPVRLFVQAGYEERGTSQPYYFSTSSPPYVVRVFDRFRCVFADVLIRAQSKKGFYFAGGLSSEMPFKGYFRKNNTSSVPPPGAIIITPIYTAAFTLGITASAGINISEKTDIDVSATYDLTPALNRTDLDVFLRTYSFSVRYYFLRPAEQ